MPPFLQAFLTPSSTAVKFALKGVIAMFLALYIALWADLERPYWAMISAAFLQIRPMSGMVIEKGLCQLGGTITGAGVGILIMALFAQARVPALIMLTAWIALCIYSASLTRNNFAYGFVMGAVTAMLVVIISHSGTSSVFEVAVARISEIGLGALCATLISALLWPTRVRHHLAKQADDTLEQAFIYSARRLEGDNSKELQQILVASLEPLMTLETDSQAARYEDPAGPGRVRGAHLLTRRTMRLLATTEALDQLLREQHSRLDANVRRLAGDTAACFRRALEARDSASARELLQHQRHITYELETPELSTLSLRVLLGLREILGHATIMLEARATIDHPEAHYLRSPSLSWHRDHLVASLNGLRAGLVFGVISIFWLVTAWTNGTTALLLATLFSGIFASYPNPARMGTTFLKGMLAALPSAFLFGHVLLSQVDGFVMLAMLMGAPLFLGLLGAGHPATIGYSLPFTVANILLTMPGNDMDFAIDNFLNRGLAVAIGVSAMVMGFRLVPALGSGIIRRRLIAATTRDLDRVARRPPQQTDLWFSDRMADRLLKLARHDEMLHEDQRHLLALGLAGLDMGRACLRLRQRLDDVDDARVQAAYRHLLDSLADGYAESAQGRVPDAFIDAARTLRTHVAQCTTISSKRRPLVDGLIERMALAFERQARQTKKALSQTA
ncbi:FUSC family protein [Halomonas sp. GXIMD04776]|uniref:FUSC family protein n=1 Tax=Halomonas sp. GXIMD04776 TaxID=3415605 RepID=UPI003C829FCA